MRAPAFNDRKTSRWFNGLLPENSRRNHLARLINAPSTATWDLLEAAGGECAGAVQVIGAQHRALAPTYARLNERELHELLSQTTVEPLRDIGAHARLSIAGAQEKATLYREPDGTWSVPLSGAVSTHILKPQSRRFPDLVANEHLFMTLARYADLPAAPTHIERIRGLDVLVIERFDRRRTGENAFERIHQEDFTQALGHRQKYQEDGGPDAYKLFSVPGPDRDALFDAFMFNWLIGNCDAHAKNYAILEPGTGHARLSPLYDAVCTEAYAMAQTLAIKVARARTLNSVNRDAVEALGKRIGYRPDEASERLRTLAQRTAAAMMRCEDEGLVPRNLKTAGILSRCKRAQDRTD